MRVGSSHPSIHPPGDWCVPPSFHPPHPGSRSPQGRAPHASATPSPVVHSQPALARFSPFVFSGLPPGGGPKGRKHRKSCYLCQEPAVHHLRAVGGLAELPCGTFSVHGTPHGAERARWTAHLLARVCDLLGDTVRQVVSSGGGWSSRAGGSRAFAMYFQSTTRY